MKPETCLMELKALETTPSILLVGHEPDFSEAIAAMLGLSSAEALKVRNYVYALSCAEKAATLAALLVKG